MVKSLAGAAASLVCLVALPVAAQSPHPSGGNSCLDRTAVRERYAALEADDTRAVDAAVAAEAAAHGLTPVTFLLDEHALDNVPAPGARARDGRVPLTMGERLTAVRPLDPGAPEGVSIETRTFRDGSVAVYLVEPPWVHRGCDVSPSPPTAWRFARGPEGHITPIHVVYREVAVDVVQCGSVACGCGSQPVTIDPFVRQYALSVHSAAEIDAPRTVHVDHHAVHLRHAEACQSSARSPTRGR